MRNRGHRLRSSIDGAAGYALEEPAFQRHPPLKRLSAKLAQHAKRVHEAMVGELSASHERAAGKANQRKKDELRRVYLKIIVTNGRQTMLSKPGADRALRMPKSRDSVEKVVAAARAMIKIAAPEKKLFADVVAKDFFAKAKALTDDLAKGAHAGALGRKSWTRAIQQTEQELRAGRQVIELMSAIVDAEFAGSVVQYKWRKSVRVGKRMGRPVKKKAGKAPQAGG